MQSHSSGTETRHPHMHKPHPAPMRAEAGEMGAAGCAAAEGADKCSEGRTGRDTGSPSGMGMGWGATQDTPAPRPPALCWQGLAPHQLGDMGLGGLAGDMEDSREGESAVRGKGPRVRERASVSPDRASFSASQTSSASTTR